MGEVLRGIWGIVDVKRIDTFCVQVFILLGMIGLAIGIKKGISLVASGVLSAFEIYTVSFIIVVTFVAFVWLLLKTVGIFILQVYMIVVWIFGNDFELFGKIGVLFLIWGTLKFFIWLDEKVERERVENEEKERLKREEMSKNKKVKK